MEEAFLKPRSNPGVDPSSWRTCGATLKFQRCRYNDHPRDLHQGLISAEQRSSLLRAAQEVIETQATLDSLADQRAAATRRVTAQMEVVRLMEERRAAGAASLLDLIRERAALISAREELARLAAANLTATSRALLARGSSPAIAS